ncbi:hypothetical protein JYU34_017664 [Plutella xylostella]|uniref:Uncharacterized protein n=1 Tax=Plutella xylostella TaxID=51655 RepID=A0ABQ7Q1W5_PLUXY|nr:hypothetical protein JYU34_017664 [Plutella xylostella]
MAKDKSRHSKKSKGKKRKGDKDKDGKEKVKKKPNKCWQALLKIRSLFWPITCNYPIYRVFFKVASFIILLYFVIFYCYLGLLERNNYWKEVHDLPTHSFPQNRMWPGMSILADRDYEYEGQTPKHTNYWYSRSPAVSFGGKPPEHQTTKNTTKDPFAI